jgi:hypothetical protein
MVCLIVMCSVNKGSIGVPYPQSCFQGLPNDTGQLEQAQVFFALPKTEWDRQ